METHQNIMVIAVVHAQVPKLYDYSFDFTPSTQPEWKCVVGTALMARTSPCIFRYTYIHKLNAHGELNYV